MEGEMDMPRGNIEWCKVTPLHQVKIRRTPKGGNSYFVVIDETGTEFVPFWGGNDSRRAQDYLNRRAGVKK